jgi:NADH-quinone oxidoreductase subunit M
LLLWIGYDTQNAAFQHLERVALIRAIGFDYFVGIDGFSMLLIVLTTGVGVLVVGVCAARHGLSRREAAGVLLQASLLGIFASLRTGDVA